MHLSLIFQHGAFTIQGCQTHLLPQAGSRPQGFLQAGSGPGGYGAISRSGGGHCGSQAAIGQVAMSQAGACHGREMQEDMD